LFEKRRGRRIRKVSSSGETNVVEEGEVRIVSNLDSLY